MKEFVIPAKAGIQRVGILIVFEILMMIVMISVADALIIESPTEGQTVVVGEPFEWKVRPSPGETCDTAISFPPFNQTTGRYEWTETLPGDAALGQRGFSIIGKPDYACGVAEVTLNVVLPPTTVLQGIEATMASDKSGTIYLYRDLAGNILRNVSHELEVDGFYSDGVKRDISIDTGTTYTSSDQKVVRPKEISQKDKVMILEALSSGKAVITVRNGSLEDTVSVEVQEKECPPGAMNKWGAVNNSACRPLKKK
jgi:hypothetical protein